MTMEDLLRVDVALVILPASLSVLSLLCVGVDLNHTPFPLHFNDFENFFGLLWALHLC